MHTSTRRSSAYKGTTASIASRSPRRKYRRDDASLILQTLGFPHTFSSQSTDGQPTLTSAARRAAARFIFFMPPRPNQSTDSRHFRSPRRRRPGDGTHGCVEHGFQVDTPPHHQQRIADESQSPIPDGNHLEFCKLPQGAPARKAVGRLEDSMSGTAQQAGKGTIARSRRLQGRSLRAVFAASASKSQVNSKSAVVRRDQSA